MESLSPQVVSAFKLLILNPNEFDLWKMRIEQYFLMTDYSLWEVILNGDSPAPTRVIEGVVQPLKFNIHKDSKTLIEAIEKRFGGNKTTKKVHKTLLKQQYENFVGSSSESLDQIHDRLNKIDLKEQSLDDLFNSLKIYESEVKSSSSARTSTQNIVFVSSHTDNINEPVSAAASVSAVSAKLTVSALPNVDTLRDRLKMVDGHADCESKEILQRTEKNLGANGPTSMGFDMSKVECYNYHRKWHFTRECRSPKDTRRNVVAEPQIRNVPVETSTSNALVSQCDGVGNYDWSFHAEEEPTNYALMAFTSSSSFRLESVEARLLVYQQNETVFEENIKLLKLDIELRDKALVVLRQKFESEKQERDVLKLKLEKFHTSSKNLSNLLASQTNDKTGLGYNTQVFTSSMFNCDDMFTFESDDSLPASPQYNRYQSGDGYHAVPPPYTGTFIPPKPDLVFNNAPNVNETVHTAFNVELSPTKPDIDLSHTHRPSAPIIED
uniref:Uncharacterized protein n=1 Tax=Tanacetum cinerariifolium TaxID=118510 RepID=A0A6L2LMC5_TANCI|nr:hypothetical protein [Tanacetum cinerariifolium]